MEKITLLYGTGNAAKLKLMKTYLEDLEQVELIGLKDLHYDWEEPEESGSDPLENARQKALCYYRTCRMPVFSADSGLFIEGLPDEEQPGVHVRRVDGKNLTDAEMRAHYKQIAARFGGRCVAQYRNGICLVFSEEERYELQSEDINWGRFYLTTDEREQRLEGFPLDAISAELETGKHFYDIGEIYEEKDMGEGFRRFFRNALEEHERRTACGAKQKLYGESLADQQEALENGRS